MIPTPPLPHLEQMPEPGWGEVLRRRVLFALKVAGLLAVIGAIVLVVFFGGRLEAFVDGMGAQTSTPLLLGLLLLYAVLISVPFLPGVEVGVAVLILFGAAGAPFVYLATLSGLLLAFCAGRLVPPARLARWLTKVGMGERALYLSPEAHPGLSEDERLCGLFRDHPVAQRFLGWRYLALGAVLNMPGNAIMGGGGGIALLAGASRAYRPAFFA
ncbi:MAG: hypothetical protein AAGJ96_04820, partial [Pseudomonadota bacterium]